MEASLTTVFGGSGFLGHHIVRELVTAGSRVRIAARRPVEPEGLASSEDAVELYTADIRDSGSVAKALEGATAAVNAVSLYAESRHGPTFDEIHVQGARRVARHSREAGIDRLIHVSGVGAGPASPSKYVRARGRGEQRVRESFPEAIVVRPTVLFGPGDDFLAALDRVTRMPVVPLFGDGSTRLQPVHVADVATAVAGLVMSPAPEHRTFELGGSEIYSYREIVELVLAERRRRRPVISMPFVAWRTLARSAPALPPAPLTLDQVYLMQADNLADENAGGFADLGMEPRSLRGALSASLP